MTLTNDDIKEIVKGVGGLLEPIHEQLKEHSKRFDHVDDRLDRVDNRLDQIDRRLDALTGSVDRLDQRVSKLEGHVGLRRAA